MCYSKEVTVAAATAMGSVIAYTWWNFTRSKSHPSLVQVYQDILVGYLCIALHQFAEFLAISTESEIIYKSGLIASISCMFFYMRALEKLSRLSFGSSIFAWLIVICAIHVFSTQMDFENFGFWVRGGGENAYLFWSGLWLALFIYWNVCVLYFRHHNTSSINKKLLIYYGFYSVNLSFILYGMCACISLFIQAASLKGLIQSWNVFTSFDLSRDSPSIWCIFSVIQVFFIPVLFKMMNESYDRQAKISVLEVTWFTKLKLLGISLLIWLIIFIGFPIFFGASFKMIL